MRRTGNIIGYINPVKKLAIKQDIEYIIARQSLAHKDDSDYSQLAVSNDDEATGLSKDQTKALGLSEGRRSIILKGFLVLEKLMPVWRELYSGNLNNTLEV